MYFFQVEAALRAIHTLKQATINEITLDCTISYKSGQIKPSDLPFHHQSPSYPMRSPPPSEYSPFPTQNRAKHPSREAAMMMRSMMSSSSSRSINNNSSNSYPGGMSSSYFSSSSSSGNGPGPRDTDLSSYPPQYPSQPQLSVAGGASAIACLPHALSLSSYETKTRSMMMMRSEAMTMNNNNNNNSNNALPTHPHPYHHHTGPASRALPVSRVTAEEEEEKVYSMASLTDALPAASFAWSASRGGFPRPDPLQIPPVPPAYSSYSSSHGRGNDSLPQQPSPAETMTMNMMQRTTMMMKKPEDPRYPEGKEEEETGRGREEDFLSFRTTVEEVTPRVSHHHHHPYHSHPRHHYDPSYDHYPSAAPSSYPSYSQQYHHPLPAPHAAGGISPASSNTTLIPSYAELTTSSTAFPPPPALPLPGPPQPQCVSVSDAPSTYTKSFPVSEEEEATETETEEAFPGSSFFFSSSSRTPSSYPPIAVAIRDPPLVSSEDLQEARTASVSVSSTATGACSSSATAVSAAPMTSAKQTSPLLSSSLGPHPETFSMKEKGKETEEKEVKEEGEVQY